MKKLFLCLLFFSLPILASDKITKLPGLKKLAQTQYAGYLSAGKHNKLFYWFLKNKFKNAPLIVWTNGGPGYSSMYGFFNETGPYLFNSNDTLKINKHGWNHFANYLVIDQPVNVGLSHLKTNKTLPSPAENTRAYLNALNSFFNKYPDLRKKPLYLAGESYAGTYLPLLTQEILRGTIKVNLKGLILISPWAVPFLQQPNDITFALKHHLISNKQAMALKQVSKQCLALIHKKNFTKANTVCQQIDSGIQHDSALLNMANIETKGAGDNTLLDNYLNNPAVRKAIHATDKTPYHAWSADVNKYYLNYIQRSVLPVYNSLLAHNVPIMIISGLSDGKDTNVYGVNAFIKRLDWPAKSQYLKTSMQPILQGKNVIGFQKQAGLLTRVTIKHAGHMVPLDQPNVAEIIKHYTTG